MKIFLLEIQVYFFIFSNKKKFQKLPCLAYFLHSPFFIFYYFKSKPNKVFVFILETISILLFFIYNVLWRNKFRRKIKKEIKIAF